MAVEGVAVEADLGVEHAELVVRGDDQRVHLQHLHVLLDEGPVELGQERGPLLGEVAVQVQRLGERPAVVREHPGGRVDLDGVDLLRGGVSDVLDVHAALGGGDHRHPAGLAVDQQREVELAGDLRALFNIEATDHAALRPGLVGHQHPVQHLLGVGADLVDRLDDADAALGVGAEALEAALAAAAGVDLRLHHEDGAAQVLRGLDRLFDRVGGEPARDGDAELFEDGLGLMLVDVHWAGGSEVVWAATGRRAGGFVPGATPTRAGVIERRPGPRNPSSAGFLNTVMIVARRRAWTRNSRSDSPGKPGPRLWLRA